MRNTGLLVVILALAATTAASDDGTIPFTEEYWDLSRAQVAEYLDRQAVIGTALLKEVEFHNGVIEFDIAATDGRSYPGLYFRIQPNGDFEHFYIRPHRTGLYADAVQYTPNIGGVGSWQIWNGPGFTAATDWEKDRWVHVKLEIKGEQCRVFLDGADNPALEVDQLKLGDVKGKIALNTLGTRRAWLSNFSYRHDDDLQFDTVPERDAVPGMLRQWEISQALMGDILKDDLHPSEYEHPELGWKAVSADGSGLLDFSLHEKKAGRGLASIFARTTIKADEASLRKYSFGYSDSITIFLNGKPVFQGRSAYTQRDSSFLGILGTYDSVYLPLEKGDNELLVLIKEVFGGWGIKFQDTTEIYADSSFTESWKIPDKFRTPETVLYDPGSKVLYVTQYDAYNRSMQQGLQSMSKVSLDGEILEKDWITGLFNPTGMVLRGGKLYVLERRAVAEIDTAAGEISKRIMLPAPGFANDLAVDNDGILYVSDSAKGMLYRSKGGEFEPWLENGTLSAPNGLHVVDNTLLIGDSGDYRLKAVDLATGNLETVVKIWPGIMDGIEDDGKGNYLLSQAEGRLYRITPRGDVTRLLELEPAGTFIANFEYIEDRNMFVIPTFTENGVIAYTVEDR